MHNEFITFNGQIRIPKISAKELDYETASGFMPDLIKFIPEFLQNYLLLENRIPPSDQHYLQFTKRITGRALSFSNIFKIDMKFGGDTSNVIEKGNSNFYPSYTTDRIYYKSRLIPEFSHAENKLSTQKIDPIRLKDQNLIESDQHLHTFAMFDELDSKDISKEMCSKIDIDLFKISPSLYPFIVYDYFTACFSTIYPSEKELKKSVKIFEPLFLYLYDTLLDIDSILSRKELIETFNEELYIDNNKFKITDDFFDTIQKYFSRFTLCRDDDLALKGWWKFNIK
ncbi:hypothetical protein ACFL20_08540 [Spirochaetota bacterium]